MEWRCAPIVADQERLTDWDLIGRMAQGSCRCGDGRCQWWQAADDFLQRNASTIDRGELAACLAAVIRHGPGKTTRVPLIVGPTNAAKSTILDPIISVFGFANVLHRPGEKASMALANLAKRGKRFIYWDEYRPVEFAARGTIPVGSFLSLFGGGSLEVQVSQSFHNGNAEVRWSRGAAMTAKDEGLWDPIPPLPGCTPVTREDIRHMQQRVHQFTARAAVPDSSLVMVPKCRESFCRWLVVESAQFANRVVERPLQQLVGRALPVLPFACGEDSAPRHGASSSDDQ